MNVGDFTFIGNNGFLTVDYLLTHRINFDMISLFDIIKPTEFSDYNAIHIHLQCKQRLRPKRDDDVVPNSEG
jgi:hypothetical protein